LSFAVVERVMSRISQPADSPPGGKPERIGFWAPAIIVAFIALTLVGTYFVRRGMLERAMANAVEIGDEATVTELAHSFPCSVGTKCERNS